MNEQEMSEILEICLARMQAGASLEEVLEQFPVQAAELRPLLEAGWMAMLLAPPADVPRAAQNRSRAAFLARAGELRPQPQPRKAHRSFFSLLAPYAALAMVMLVVLFGGGLASARALPGDLLYPVKINVERAGQMLVSDVPARLSSQVAFEDRRAEEVRRLLASGREEAVHFGGFLDGGGSGWLAGGIPLRVAPDFTFPVESLAGSYVDVQGITQADGFVLVQNLSLRLFVIRGTIQGLDEALWQVAGMNIIISPQTLVGGEARVGAPVQITAILLPGSQWLALTAQVEGAPLPPTASPLPETTITTAPTPTQTLSPAPTDELTPKPSPTDAPQKAPFGGDDDGGHDSGDDDGDDDDDDGGDDDDDDDDDD